MDNLQQAIIELNGRNQTWLMNERSLFWTKRLVILLLVTTISGCGRPHVSSDMEMTNLEKYKKMCLTDVNVTSKEQTEDTEKINRDTKVYIYDFFALKKIYGCDAAEMSSTQVIPVDISVYSVFGSRALRYFIGFGAGSGSSEIKIVLKDPQGGEPLYKESSTAKLVFGMFGGSMQKVINKNTRAAMQKFVSDIMARYRHLMYVDTSKLIEDPSE